jgi:hypothetical protein
MCVVTAWHDHLVLLRSVERQQGCTFGLVAASSAQCMMGRRRVDDGARSKIVFNGTAASGLGRRRPRCAPLLGTARAVAPPPGRVGLRGVVADEGTPRSRTGSRMVSGPSRGHAASCAACPRENRVSKALLSHEFCVPSFCRTCRSWSPAPPSRAGPMAPCCLRAQHGLC